MILTLLLTAAQPSALKPPPELRAVMDRSRREARKARIDTTDGVAVPTNATAKAGSIAPQSIPLPPEVAARLKKCLDLAMSDPVAGVREAGEWVIAGGGFSAEQCKGFAYARGEKWPDAVAAFDAAATLAQKAGSPADAARLWVQAGNAALAGGQAEKALGYLDSGLASGQLDGLAKGETYLDHARANVALNRLPQARTDIDRAIELAPQDPLVWLLSAALARRMDDLKRAGIDIARAAQLSPDDASVALEQGNIAVLTGQNAIAREAWGRAIKLSPKGPQAKAATASLAELDATEKNLPPPASQPAPAAPR